MLTALVLATIGCKVDRQAFDPLMAEYAWSEGTLQARFGGKVFELEGDEPPIPNTLQTEVRLSGYVFRAEKHDLAVYKDGKEVARHKLGYSQAETVEPWTEKIVFGMHSFGKEVYVFACLRSLNHSGTPVGGGEVVRVYAPRPETVKRGGAPSGLGRYGPAAAYMGATADHLYFLCDNEFPNVLKVSRHDLSTEVERPSKTMGVDAGGSAWGLVETDGRQSAARYVLTVGLSRPRQTPFAVNRMVTAARTGSELYFLQDGLLFRPSHGRALTLGSPNPQRVFSMGPYLMLAYERSVEIVDSRTMTSLGTRPVTDQGP